MNLQTLYPKARTDAIRLATAIITSYPSRKQDALDLLAIAEERSDVGAAWSECFLALKGLRFHTPSYQDIGRVFTDLYLAYTDNDIATAQRLYQSYLTDDPAALWDQVIEQIIYQESLGLPPVAALCHIQLLEKEIVEPNHFILVSKQHEGQPIPSSQVFYYLDGNIHYMKALVNGEQDFKVVKHQWLSRDDLIGFSCS